MPEMRKDTANTTRLYPYQDAGLLLSATAELQFNIDQEEDGSNNFEKSPAKLSP
jgi:hypothetical protein